jgi:hypothetical protein
MRPGGCRDASKETHGCFEAHDSGDPRTFSLLLRSPNKGNKEMVVCTFAVLMEKSPGVVSVISAFRMAPPAVTNVDGDGDA